MDYRGNIRKYLMGYFVETKKFKMDLGRDYMG